jgi:hypothetical protein
VSGPSGARARLRFAIGRRREVTFRILAGAAVVLFILGAALSWLERKMS